MIPRVPKSPLTVLVAALFWIAWCVLVITELVPHIRRHLTMWPWLIAYVLCLLPGIALAVFIVLGRSGRTNATR